MKVSIIGAGNVGASAAQYLLLNSNNLEIVLLDIKEGISEGKAIDLMQSMAFNSRSSQIIGVTNDYSATANSDIVVITSGVPRKPGMTREELVGINANVLKSVLDQVNKESPKAFYVIVSNPMDTMTYFTYKYLNISPERVIGMGGILDSARFRYYIAKELNLSIQKVQKAKVIGGHGDTTMVPLVSKLMFRDFNPIKLTEEQERNIVSQTMKGGATLTNLLGTSAWYGPGAAIGVTVMELIENYIFFSPYSVYRKEYDLYIGSIADIYLETDDGKSHVEIYNENELGLSNQEIEAFQKSVEAVRKVNEALPL